MKYSIVTVKISIKISHEVEMFILKFNILVISKKKKETTNTVMRFKRTEYKIPVLAESFSCINEMQLNVDKRNFYF